MAIPTFDAFLRPYLALLASGPPLSATEVDRRLQASSGLTPDELAYRHRRNKATTVQIAISHARTCLFDAGLIGSADGLFRITDSGRAFIDLHPTTISIEMVREIPWLKARNDATKARNAATKARRDAMRKESTARTERKLRETFSAPIRPKGERVPSVLSGVEGERRSLEQISGEVVNQYEYLVSRVRESHRSILWASNNVQEQFAIYLRLSGAEPPKSPADVDEHCDNLQHRLPRMKEQASRLMAGQHELEQLLLDLNALESEQETLKLQLAAPTLSQAQNRPAIFISYSSKDEAIAAELCRVVEQAKFPCWYSDRDLKPGKAAYPIRITEAIDKSWIVVVLLSEDSLKSQFVANELDHATGAKKGFLPIVVKDFRGELTPEFKFHLGRYQRLKFPLADAELIKTVERLWDEHAKKQH